MYIANKGIHYPTTKCFFFPEIPVLTEKLNKHETETFIIKPKMFILIVFVCMCVGGMVHVCLFACFLITT